MPGSKNGDGTLAWLRDRNRQRVMEILRMHGQISQADIARATGLSRTTVSTLIAELKEAGLVADVDTRSAHARGGRPGVQLVLRNPAHVVVGIDFGHSHVAIAVADLGHNVLAERRHDLDVNREAARALDVAAAMFAEVLSEVAVERTSVLGVGMGVPGPVDRAHGTAGSATILPGWVGLRIASEMEQRLGVPVQIENDANLGALAELTWGAGRDCSNFAYIKAATGIGAGIVIDGRLLRGATGTAGTRPSTSRDRFVTAATVAAWKPSPPGRPSSSSSGPSTVRPWRCLRSLSSLLAVTCAAGAPSPTRAGRSASLSRGSAISSTPRG